MKLVVVLVVAGVLLAGCEAKRKGKGKPGSSAPHQNSNPDPESHRNQCETSLSKMLGLSRGHDVVNMAAVITCLESHGYDGCNPNLDHDTMEQMTVDCEVEIKDMITAISGVIGRHAASWEDELFPRERVARRTGTRTRTSTRSGTRAPSVCRDFSFNFISFLNAIRSQLASIIRGVTRCFSGSRSNLISCLFNFFTDFIAPFLRNNFVRCLLSLFGV